MLVGDNELRPPSTYPKRKRIQPIQLADGTQNTKESTRADTPQFIIPGSQTTRAQLGINDTYAPIHHEFKTRMFPAGEGKWEPVKVRKMNKPKPKTGDGDVTMAGTDDGPKEEDEDSEYEEDPQSEEGAVYPLKGSHHPSQHAHPAWLTIRYRGQNRQHARLPRPNAPHPHHPLPNLTHTHPHRHPPHLDRLPNRRHCPFLLRAVQNSGLINGRRGSNHYMGLWR